MKSEPPSGQSLVPELGSESGMTPLHLAAYSGNENVVRLLLNSAGVQVDAATTENVSSLIRLAHLAQYQFDYKISRDTIHYIWPVLVVICRLLVCC